MTYIAIPKRGHPHQDPILPTPNIYQRLGRRQEYGDQVVPTWNPPPQRNLYFNDFLSPQTLGQRTARMDKGKGIVIQGELDFKPPHQKVYNFKELTTPRRPPSRKLIHIINNDHNGLKVRVSSGSNMPNIESIKKIVFQEGKWFLV